MSFDDNIIWRAHLDVYNMPAEPMQITKVTHQYIWIEEWSGCRVFPDGSSENIGKRKTIRLDRDELRAGWVQRGRIVYAFDNPDEGLAPANEDDTPLPRSPEYLKRKAQLDDMLRELEAKRAAIMAME